MRESPSKSGLTDLWETLGRRQGAGPVLPARRSPVAMAGSGTGLRAPPRHATPCHATPRHVTPRRDMPCHATPRHRLAGLRGAVAAVPFLGSVKPDILTSLYQFNLNPPRNFESNRAFILFFYFSSKTPLGPLTLCVYPWQMTACLRVRGVRLSVRGCTAARAAAG